MSYKPFVTKNDGIDVKIIKQEVETGVNSYEVLLTKSPDAQSVASNEEILINWIFPYLDCTGVWHPTCGSNRSVNADWDSPARSMTASSAPVMSIFSEDGENRFTVAVSETKEVIDMQAGIHEEDGTLLFLVKIPRSYVEKDGSYSITILENTAAVPFYEALGRVTTWWEKDCGIEPIPVGDDAREPVFSTWYSFHQDINDKIVEEECKIAKELGFETVILDDGWQTDDNNRGYAYCGDWEVSKNRFPDFGKHIEKIHGLGMKYMLWYSVPFVGIESEMWDSVKDKILFYSEGLKAGVLDPRYPEVREYLITTYENAVKEWKIDGFKMDFIDQIFSRVDSPAFNENMDYSSVQEALDCLMSGIYEALAKHNPDIMIEFRQRYIGPNMRKYGNMFRVTDCPNSAIRNRVGVVDLRMLSGNTAVHSDPLMWHLDEKPELMAIQIISSIFSTVQISVKLTESSDETLGMLKFWLDFMKEHKTLLLETPLKPEEPHNLYPVVWADDGKTGIAAVYTENRIMKLPTQLSKSIMLNATKAERITIEVEEETKIQLLVKDCKGIKQNEETKVFPAGIHVINVPSAGQLYMEIVK